MSKRRNFNYAQICLEKWVLWRVDHAGHQAIDYSKESGSPSHPTSSIPRGVEPRDIDVERANAILSIMESSSSKSARRADLLKIVTAARRDKESIANAIKRVGIKASESAYYHALEEFDIRLEMMIYNKK